MLPEALQKRLQPYGVLDQSQSLSPALTLDEFFTGNTDEGSIGCNLFPHPGIRKFETQLGQLAARSDVLDVRFPVTEYVDGLDWPFVDKVIVVTTASAEDIFDACKDLQPDESWAADADELSWVDDINIPDGYAAVIVWWD